MKVHVTADDIRDGVRGSSTGCAIARSLHRAGYPHAEVCNYKVHPDERSYGVGIRLPLPPIAIVFVHAYDANEGVIPIEFDLDWNLPAIVTTPRALEPAAIIEAPTFEEERELVLA